MSTEPSHKLRPRRNHTAHKHSSRHSLTAPAFQPAGPRPHATPALYHVVPTMMEWSPRNASQENLSFHTLFFFPKRVFLAGMCEVISYPTSWSWEEPHRKSSRIPSDLRITHSSDWNKNKSGACDYKFLRTPSQPENSIISWKTSCYFPFNWYGITLTQYTVNITKQNKWHLMEKEKENLSLDFAKPFLLLLLSSLFYFATHFEGSDPNPEAEYCLENSHCSLNKVWVTLQENHHHSL